MRIAWHAAIAALAATAGTVAAAEATGLRAEVYAGAGAGLALSAVGMAAGWRILARGRRAAGGAGGSAGKRDIWGLWAAGVLGRFALLAAASVLFGMTPRFDAPVAMIALGAVSLAGLYVETRWVSAALAGTGIGGKT
jgi:hypothetical protein